MAFSQGWSFRNFSLFPRKPPSQAPLQMGPLLAEPRTQPASAASLSKGIDLEFDAVILDTLELVEHPSSQLQAKETASGSGDVLEWLEAAVFGEDEDFGALLVEPLTARVALGPIYDDIFGNAAAVSKASRWPGAGEDVPEQPVRFKARGVSGQAAESDSLGQLGGNAGLQSAEQGSGKYDALQTIMDILQNVFQEESIVAEELERSGGFGPLSGDIGCGANAGPSEVPGSWAAVAGSLASRAPTSNPKTAGRAAMAKHKAGGAGLNLLLADAVPPRGCGQRWPSRQGLAVEAGNLSAEWGPVKEDRNPRVRAGKWKTHGNNRRFKNAGNFGNPTKAGGGCWKGGLQSRLHKKADVRRECMAGDFQAG